MPSNNYGVDINPENLKNGSLAQTLDPWAYQQTTGYQSGQLTNTPKAGGTPPPEGDQAPAPADQ